MTPFFDVQVAGWVAQRIDGCDRGFGQCQAMGVLHKGKVIAGVVFHNWCPEHDVIELSAASDDPRWFNRNVINTMLGYVFESIPCQMALANIGIENKRARSLWAAVGAQEHVIPRLRGRDRDGVICTLTDDAWRKSKFYKG